MFLVSLFYILLLGVRVVVSTTLDNDTGSLVSQNLYCTYYYWVIDIVVVVKIKRTFWPVTVTRGSLCSTSLVIIYLGVSLTWWWPACCILRPMAAQNSVTLSNESRERGTIQVCNRGLLIRHILSASGKASHYLSNIFNPKTFPCPP